MNPFLYKLITVRELMKAAALVLVLTQVLGFGLGHGQVVISKLVSLKRFAISAHEINDTNNQMIIGAIKSKRKTRRLTGYNVERSITST